MKVGFIGLGGMGSCMAHNLLTAGYELLVHDLRRDSAAPLEAAGATWVATVADLGRAADVVFTSLPGPQEMQEVGLGENGLLSTMRPGGIWFDLTTNSPVVVREVHAACREHDIELFDAPVSGGPKGARASWRSTLAATVRRSNATPRCSTPSATRCSTSARSAPATRRSWCTTAPA